MGNACQKHAVPMGANNSRDCVVHNYSTRDKLTLPPPGDIDDAKTYALIHPVACALLASSAEDLEAFREVYPTPTYTGRMCTNTLVIGEERVEIEVPHYTSLSDMRERHNAFLNTFEYITDLSLDDFLTKVREKFADRKGSYLEADSFRALPRGGMVDMITLYAAFTSEDHPTVVGMQKEYEAAVTGTLASFQSKTSREKLNVGGKVIDNPVFTVPFKNIWKPLVIPTQTTVVFATADGGTRTALRIAPERPQKKRRTDSE